MQKAVKIISEHIEKTFQIIIVDNDESFLQNTSEFLEEEGFECECYNSCKKAKTMLATGSYDLLIADINMAGNRKLELVRTVQDVSNRLPVILVTDKPTIDSAIQSLDLTVAGYFPKPIKREKFIEKVRSTLITFRMYGKIFSESDQQMRSLCQDLTQLHDLHEKPWKREEDGAIHAFLALMSTNIVNSLVNVKHVTDALLNDRDRHEVEIQRAKLMIALMETVEILKATKMAFRSKELGMLRKNLESLLEETELMKN